MTANQIILPMILVAVTITAIALVINAKRAKRDQPEQSHTAQSGNTQNDKESIARSVASGHLDGGR